MAAFAHALRCLGDCVGHSACRGGKRVMDGACHNLGAFAHRGIAKRDAIIGNILNNGLLREGERSEHGGR